MDDALTRVHYAVAAQHPAFQRVLDSPFVLDETVERLKRAMEEADVWLVHEINPQVLLKRGGFSIAGARQLLFFHPRYMVQILERDPSAVIEAPLKLVVMETPDARVTVRCLDVAAQFARYPTLTELGRQLDGLCQRLLGVLRL